MKRRKVKMAVKMATIIIVILALAIALAFWRNTQLEQRYQDRTAQAAEVAREIALEKCRESEYRDNCDALQVYPPDDSMPIGYDEAWSFTAKTSSGDPADGFWYNITIITADGVSYHLHSARDMNTQTLH